MRFVAPVRAEVAPARFDHPVFAGYGRHRDLLVPAEWPSLDELNRRMMRVDAGMCFVEQTPGLLADGLHYELRIARRGEVATRASNWHDLLNALIWIEHAPLKRALNALQVADIERVGPRQRTRRQCALTHFDEAGAIIVLREPEALAAWDAHDWPALFAAAPAAVAAIIVFGHALLEHALWPEPSLVAKCLVVAGAPAAAAAEAAVIDAVAAGRLLADPQELRPLPLSGLPGWHARAGDPAFYRSAPCFRPLRPGRAYPPPLFAA